jgi:hypothetical protein
MAQAMCPILGSPIPRFAKEMANRKMANLLRLPTSRFYTPRCSIISGGVFTTNQGESHDESQKVSHTYFRVDRERQRRTRPNPNP